MAWEFEGERYATSMDLARALAARVERFMEHRGSDDEVTRGLMADLEGWLDTWEYDALTLLSEAVRLGPHSILLDWADSLVESQCLLDDGEEAFGIRFVREEVLG